MNTNSQSNKSLALLQENVEFDQLSWDGIVNFSERLSTLIPSLQSNIPLLISGDWGSGKTSLLRHVKKQLEDKEKLENKKYHCVWFDAWRYEHEDSLISCLIRVIWQASPNKAQWKSELASLLKITSAMAVRGAGIFGLKGFSIKGLKDDTNSMQFGWDQPEILAIDFLIEKLANWIKSSYGDNRVYVFIDDLDRCGPDSSMFLIEKIRFLINSADAESRLNIQFIVIMDKTNLADAIGKKYPFLNPYDSNRYMEKLFPIAMEVPRPEVADITDFITRQADNLCQQEQAILNDDDINTLSQVLSNSIYANPRLIKRCMNRLALLKTLEEYSRPQHPNPGPDPNPNTSIDLVTWIAATERWPLLRKLLWRKSDEFWRNITENINKAEGNLSDIDARELVDLPGIREFFATIAGNNLYQYIEAFESVDQRLRRQGL